MTSEDEPAGETMWDRAQRKAEARRRYEARSYGVMGPMPTREDEPGREPTHEDDRAHEDERPREDEAARERAEIRARQEHAYGLARAARDRAVRNVWVGALTSIVGIVITAVSYSAASSSSGGGRYVVAYGAIIFGGIQFVRGLVGLASDAPRPPSDG